MRRRLLFVTSGFVAVSVAGGALAAKPPSAGGSDSTPPGVIQSLTAIPATRAITLRFVATGDDGSSGRAAGYDVYYNEGTCESNGTPPGVDWIQTPRSAETTAYTSGSVDYFNVHSGDSSDGDGLAPGMPYCVAIRARDEKPNYGLWRSIDVTTLGIAGDWQLSSHSLTDGNRAIAVNFDYPDVSLEPVLGWVVADPSGPSARTSMQFESSAWGVRHDVNAAPISRIDAFRMKAIPDGSGRVGAVFGGRRDAAPYGNFHLLVEVGPTGPSLVETAVTGLEGAGGIAPPGSGITYVQRDGEWNPVVALERIVDKTVSKGRVTWSTRLDVVERVYGVWQAPTSTAIQRTDTSAAPFYRGAELFTKPGDGRTLGVVVSHCGVLMYAERDPDTGQWTYWDAGPGPAYYLDNNIAAVPIQLSVSFSDVGEPVVARRTAHNGVIQITHPLRTGAFEVTPTASCAGVVSRRPTAWEDVSMTPDPDVPYIGVTAVAEVQGDVYLSVNAFNPWGKTADQRLVYRCAGSSSWQVASIDRTNGNAGTAGVGPLVVNGSIRRAYGWNWASHAGSGSGGTNELAYSTLPDDFVVLASQPVTCP